MLEDTRCCGTGTCLINADGFCWCGQQWDGEKMCFAAPGAALSSQAEQVAQLTDAQTHTRSVKPDAGSADAAAEAH